LRAAGNEYLLTYETRFVNGSHRVLEAVDALLAIGPAGRPTALFCWNDSQAFAVLAALTERGVSVPEDMSLISVDDVPQAALHSPPLTTFRQPLQQIGKTAAEVLLRQIQLPVSAAGRLDLPHPETHTLDAELIVRGSTSAPPAFR
jgi:LacI family transcriptional regulator